MRIPREKGVIYSNYEKHGLSSLKDPIPFKNYLYQQISDKEIIRIIYDVKGEIVDVTTTTAHKDRIIMKLK